MRRVVAVRGGERSRWGAAPATTAALLLLTITTAVDDVDAGHAAVNGNDDDATVPTTTLGGWSGSAWAAPRRSLTSQYTGPRDTRAAATIAHQGLPGRRTVISQQNVGALAVEFKTVLTFSLPLVRGVRWDRGSGAHTRLHTPSLVPM